MKKKWTPIETDEAPVRALQGALGIHPILCRLLVQRGIHTFDAARAFFRPSEEQLHDPFLMRDMDKAVDRLIRAVDSGEKILVYGDYDVDGVTAVAALYSFLAELGAVLDYYLPDRYREGYGVSMAGIEYARREGAGLIVALDCGIRAVEPVTRAKEWGIDFIVADHHLPGSDLPPALAILDPKREGDAYPYSDLSGCGIAVKLAQAFCLRKGAPEKDWHSLLDLLAVSIASDIVPVTGENRTLAWLGLRRLNTEARTGLRALLAASGRRRPVRISDIVFGIGPMINAAGRMADAEQAVKLLLTRDPKVADDYVRVLAHRNGLRREYDRRLAEEAAAMFEEMPDREERSSLVLYQPHWHQGVVGIAASRMVERFHRPSIILTRSDHLVVGSARSVRGLDIHEAIHRCRDLLIDFGGHRHAAGLKMPPGNVAVFQDRFEAVVREMLPPGAPAPTVGYAAELPLREITPAFWRILRQFAPFGPGNRNPVFLARGVRDAGFSRVLRGNHLRLSVRQGDSAVFAGIAFDQGGAYAKVATRRPFDICFSLEEDRFRGDDRIQLVVKDLRFSE